MGVLRQEKKQMVTHNKELLMAFVYFDQSHCGYLLERDLEEILYTLGLHLSRAQVNKALIDVQSSVLVLCVHDWSNPAFSISERWCFDISRSRSC